jgi:hypothetical protein
MVKPTSFYLGPLKLKTNGTYDKIMAPVEVAYNNWQP